MLPGDAPHAVPDDAGAEGGSQPAGRAVGPGVGEVLRGKFDADGAFRPLTAAEARDRGIPDYDPETGKVGPDVRGVRRLGLRAGRGRLEEPRHGAALGRRPGRVVRHHPGRLPSPGKHHVCGRRATGRQF